jgi:anhydro-N-acetylmuramic acid kinase
LELTARSIAAALGSESLAQLAVCGGGAKNTALMTRLSELLYPSHVITTEALGVNPDWVEAAAFAWLASRTVDGLPGNEPSVTGATGYRVLGAVFRG